MKKIKVLAPAKINFNLKVQKRRADGFHPIVSFMQSISLFDFLTLEITNEGIEISGTSDEIPYDSSNLAFRAAEKFFEASNFKGGVNIYIEKNIPVCAGLAGGSTDAAAVLFGLNKLTGGLLERHELHKICSELGSDLNFCLEGGAKICKGRGEILEETEFKEMPITLVKPCDLKISAGEAYKRFDETKTPSNLPNDLEYALLPYYKELQNLHDIGFQMSGSGPSFFKKAAFLDEKEKKALSKNHIIVENLKTVSYGVKAV